MAKTVMQEVAEFLEARAKALEAGGIDIWERDINMAVAREFRLLSEHVHAQLAARGLHTAPEEAKPADG
jgi:hypothetical protein